ncbi:hypothetical protein ACJX0J_033482, partial [Zea mays]
QDDIISLSIPQLIKHLQDEKMPTFALNTFPDKKNITVVILEFIHPIFMLYVWGFLKQFSKPYTNGTSVSKEIQIITTSIIGIAKNFGKVKKQTINPQKMEEKIFLQAYSK